MRIPRLQIALALGLGAALAVSLAFILFQSKKLGECRQELDSSSRSLREVREAFRQSELRGATNLSKAHTSETRNRAAIAQRDSTIEELNRTISESQTEIGKLQGELSAARLENKQTLASLNERDRKLQAAWQSRLSDLQKQLKSVQADLQDSRQRTVALEAANAKLRTIKSASSARATEREQLLDRLQDVNRRREAYLTSISNRYHEITSRFRTMSGMLDANREQDTSAYSGAALDLIQNAISLAETDFEHLSDLDAKAFRLEKELAKR